MRNNILFFAALLALTAGCQRAEIDSSPAPLEFRDIVVSIGEDATRSLISIEAEDFREACLFAFDASSNEVLTYPEHAGDLEGTKPVAIHTTQKSFNWALPIGKALDIYVIVNYGSELGETLASYLTNSNLTKSALDAMKFTALDNVYMSDIEASGIPMSGVVHATLANENSPLSVTVKRLFAKYILSFNLSDLAANNASLQALHIVTENVNTEVPFFQDNFKQTVRSKFKEYDRASNLDLEQIQSGQPIVLYVPENCQGDITSPVADKWYNVQGALGSKVANCTYVDMSVKIVDADGCWKNYNTALYLGNDCRTNFDVVRNASTAITVKIPYSVPIIDGEDYFYFDSHNLVTVNGGEDVTLNFDTNLDYRTEVAFSYTDAASGEQVWNAFSDQIVGTDNVKLTANSTYSGRRFIVTGGNASKSAQDQKPVEITSSSVILDDYIPEDGTIYLEFHFVTRVNGQDVYTTYRTDGSNWTIDEAGQWYSGDSDMKVPVNRSGNTGVVLNIIGYIWLNGEKITINADDGHIPGLRCQISSRHSDDERLEDTWCLREYWYWSTYGDYTSIDIYDESDSEPLVIATVYWADGPVASDYITPSYDNGDTWAYLNVRGLNNQWFGHEMSNNASNNLQVKVGSNGCEVKIYVEGEVWLNGLKYTVYDDETRYHCDISGRSTWGLTGMRQPGSTDIVTVYGRKDLQIKYYRITYVQ